MRNIWNIAINDLRVYLKDPGSLVNMFVVPIMIAVILGFGLGGTGGGPTQIRVDVIDHDQSALSDQFMKDLREANNTLLLCPFDNGEGDPCSMGEDTALTEELYTKRLTENTALALIEIPEGFEAGVESGEAQTIIYRSNENISAPSYILQAVQAVVQRMGGAQVAATVGVGIADRSGAIPFKDDAEKATFRQAIYTNAADLWQQDPFAVNFQQSAVDPSDQLSSTQRGFGQTIPGIGSMFVVIFVMTSMITLPQERKNWTLQRLATMPISRPQILGGKILMFFLLGMIQFLSLFAVGRLVGLNLGNDVVALLLIMVSLVLCATALAFALGTFVRTEMQGAALVNLLGLTLAPLGGAWWPLDIVPEFMRVIGHASPIAWAMDGFHALLFNQGTLSDVLLPIGVLLAMAVVFFGIAIARFRYD
jgi:ABC-2 type transport system permease protein